MASAAATPPAASALSCAPSFGHARLDRRHRHRDADETGLAHEHVGGGAADGLRGELAHAQRVGPALVAGGGVGVAGVEHDRGGAAVGEVAAADLHRRRGDQVGGEHTGRGRPARWSTVATMARSGVARLLDARGEPAGREPGNGGDAHGMSPIVESAVVSGRPSTRLAFCSAWPDAPFTRLSSAPIASTVLVRSS